MDSKIGVCIITGFLGAGKTTLINNILERIRTGVGVLVREFGTVSIDDLMLRTDKSNILVFSGVSTHEHPQQLLYEYLEHLAEPDDENGKEPVNFETLLIEASGADEPDTLAQLFFLGHMREYYELKSFITVVDAQYGAITLDEYPEAAEQIVYADHIIINKTDLATEKDIVFLVERIKSINALADIYLASYADVNIERVMETDDFAHLTSVKLEGKKMFADKMTTAVLRETKPLDKSRTNKWFDEFYNKYGMKILRGKGFLHFNEDNYKYEFQSVRKSWHSKADTLWNEGETESTVVLILDKSLAELPLQQSFDKCVSIER